MALLFVSVVSLNRCRSIKSILIFTFKCLYNGASLSRFTSFFSRKVDFASVVAGSINDASSTLLVFGIL